MMMIVIMIIMIIIVIIDISIAPIQICSKRFTKAKSCKKVKI